MRRARSYSGSATGVRAEPKTETAGGIAPLDAKAALELVGHPPDATGVRAHDRHRRRLRVEQLLVGGGGHARVDHGGRRYRRRMDRRTSGQSENDGRRAHPSRARRPARRRRRPPSLLRPSRRPTSRRPGPTRRPPSPAAGGGPTAARRHADGAAGRRRHNSHRMRRVARHRRPTRRPRTPRPPSPCPLARGGARRADRGSRATLTPQVRPSGPGDEDQPLGPPPEQGAAEGRSAHRPGGGGAGGGGRAGGAGRPRRRRCRAGRRRSGRGRSGRGRASGGRRARGARPRRASAQRRPRAATGRGRPREPRQPREKGPLPFAQLRAAAESVLQGYGGRRALRDAFPSWARRSAPISPVSSPRTASGASARNIAAGSLGAGRLGKALAAQQISMAEIEDLWAIVLSKEEAAACQASVRDARGSATSARQAPGRAPQQRGPRLARRPGQGAGRPAAGAQVRIVIEGRRSAQARQEGEPSPATKGDLLRPARRLRPAARRLGPDHPPTWNVAARVARLDEQADAVLALEPDLVALQEVTRTTTARWREAPGRSGAAPAGRPVAFRGAPPGRPARRPHAAPAAIAARRPPGRTRAVAAAVALDRRRVRVLNLHSPISQRPGLVKVRTLEAATPGWLPATRPPSSSATPTPRAASTRTAAPGASRGPRAAPCGPSAVSAGRRPRLGVMVQRLGPHGYADAFRAVHGYGRKEVSLGVGARRRLAPGPLPRARRARSASARTSTRSAAPASATIRRSWPSCRSSGSVAQPRQHGQDAAAGGRRRRAGG